MIPLKITPIADSVVTLEIPSKILIRSHPEFTARTLSEIPETLAEVPSREIPARTH